MVAYINMISKHINDITGKKFGRLTVIKFALNKGAGRHSYWHCRCSCGNETISRGSHLRIGQTKSCGCLSAEVARNFLKKYTNSNKHRGSGNPAWKGKETKYSSIHAWLSNNYKKNKCKICGTEKNLDWALIRGKKHDHNRKNCMILCRSHHIKYDKKS